MNSLERGNRMGRNARVAAPLATTLLAALGLCFAGSGSALANPPKHRCAHGKAPCTSGIASWYGREFQGRRTASGETFDPGELTAAHPSLPFQTRLLVTNPANGRSV